MRYVAYGSINLRVKENQAEVEVVFIMRVMAIYGHLYQNNGPNTKPLKQNGTKRAKNCQKNFKLKQILDEIAKLWMKTKL